MPDLSGAPAMATENVTGRSRPSDSVTGLSPVDPPSAVPPAMPQGPSVGSGSTSGSNGSIGGKAANGVSNGTSSGRSRSESAKSGESDADLSQREKELLRQLHEELAKREEQTPESAAEPFAWHVDRSAGQRSGAYPAVEYGGSWQGNPDQTAVNGIPPYGMPQG
jgi:hypothetical protein